MRSRSLVWASALCFVCFFFGAIHCVDNLLLLLFIVRAFVWFLSLDTFLCSLFLLFTFADLTDRQPSPHQGPAPHTPSLRVRRVSVRVRVRYESVEMGETVGFEAWG